MDSLALTCVSSGRRCVPRSRSFIRRPCCAAPASSPWKYSARSHVIARGAGCCLLDIALARARATSDDSCETTDERIIAELSQNGSWARPRAISLRHFHGATRNRESSRVERRRARVYITFSPAFHALMIMTRKGRDRKDRVAGSRLGIPRRWRDLSRLSRGSMRAHSRATISIPPGVYSRGGRGEGLRRAGWITVVCDFATCDRFVRKYSLIQRGTPSLEAIDMDRGSIIIGRQKCILSRCDYAGEQCGLQFTYNSSGNRRTFSRCFRDPSLSPNDVTIIHRGITMSELMAVN